DSNLRPCGKVVRNPNLMSQPPAAWSAPLVILVFGEYDTEADRGGHRRAGGGGEEHHRQRAGGTVGVHLHRYRGDVPRGGAVGGAPGGGPRRYASHGAARPGGRDRAF